MTKNEEMSWNEETIRRLSRMTTRHEGGSIRCSVCGATALGTHAIQHDNECVVKIIGEQLLKAMVPAPSIELKDHLGHVGRFLNELAETMGVDLGTGEVKVEAACEAILAAARHGREWAGRALEGLAELEALQAPVPMFLTCPVCHARHVDEGEFATKPHHTHACQDCGVAWRPAVVPTVGVRFLPGFKDGLSFTVTASAAPDEVDVARFREAVEKNAGWLIGWLQKQTRNGNLR